jgi:hypothetical protein
MRNAESARVHIIAAQAAPHRKELELRSAKNLAALIKDRTLKQTILNEISRAE